MYLHIGGSEIISLENMIGIFTVDLRKDQNNDDFLKKFPPKRLAEADLKKHSSIIITRDKVYYSTISPLTLMKRIDNNE
jgi:hypothetical protein